MPTCTKCNADLPTEGGLRRHMTTVHSEPTSAEPSNDKARFMGANKSMDDVRKNAPSDESQGDRAGAGAGAARGPGKKTREEQERAEKIKKAMETVGRINIRSVSKLPYDAWALVLNNPAFKLTPEEHKELTESYMLLAEAFGVDFTGKIWAINAVCAINGEMIVRRLGMMGFDMSDEETAGNNGNPVQ